MQRGSDHSGGLGPQLVGEKIVVNRRVVSVVRQLGEGGFSFVYLVKDISEDTNDSSSSSNNNINKEQHSTNNNNGSSNHNSSNKSNNHSGNNHNSNTLNNNDNQHIVLKITSIHSRQQRDIAEKEANLLSKLSHPSIVRMIDSCYRSYHNNPNSHHVNLYNPLSDKNIIHMANSDNHNHYNSSNNTNNGMRHQHLILMEHCESGTAHTICSNLKAQNKRFDLPSLIIAFGQICNAVSYLHAQRPPIVHRDLKPVNFLVKNGAYKLCDFGSAVFGHVDLRTSRARAEAEEVIQKTTTQMFRSPEMVDLYMSKKLTQSTDVWALGCCLYSLAFLQNCFEEGSNLAILSRNFKIPDDNPYGDDLVDLIDRMLTVNCKERADMTEVILCLSAIYSGKPLPPRKHSTKSNGKHNDRNKDKVEKEERVGTYRTDGQGIRKSVMDETMRPREAKKLNPNSAAARRRKAAEEGGGGIMSSSSIPLTRQSSKISSSIPLTKQPSKPPKPIMAGSKSKQQQRGESGGVEGGGGLFSHSFTSSSYISEFNGFSETEDPFQIGEGHEKNNSNSKQHTSRSFFTSKDSYAGTDTSSQDWGGDFSSENGSGFDNFGSSDDGSRSIPSSSFGKSAAVFLKKMSTPKDSSGSVPAFASDDFARLNFDNFGVSDNQFALDDEHYPVEQGFEATYSEKDATTSILSDLNSASIGATSSGGSIDRHRKKKGIRGFFGKSNEKIESEI